MSNTPAGHYRREIDGLRAIAVLSVVLFHFGVPGVPGGFIGVDIFFVISGFLICGLLWSELKQTGTVKLAKFYGRRIRRLAPAFVLMALVSSLVGYFVLLPFEFKEFGKGLIASTAYLSNILFYRQTGYFDNAAEEKVLLHTWSLSVEEQFYIVLPILMILLGAAVRWLPWLLTALLVVSLLACIAVTQSSHSAAFYLFPFRAWELLAGVLLAVWGIQKQDTWSHGLMVSGAGLGLILGGIFMIQPDGNFPGMLAIVPVLGALLVLWGGRDVNMINRLLATPVPVFFGLISYSLYLWHWPIVSFAKYIFGEFSSVLEVSFLIISSVILATLSWAYVERPFRQRPTNSKVFHTFLAAFAASCVLFTIGGTIFVAKGLPDRFGPEARLHIDASADFVQDWSRCSVALRGPFEGLDVCKLGPEDRPAEVLVWGDSHVRAYAEGLALAAKEAQRPGLLIWTAGCPPIFGTQKHESAATNQENKHCSDVQDRMQKALPKMQGITDILLIGRWGYYYHGKGIGNDRENVIDVRRDGQITEQSQKDVVSLAIEQSVTMMKNYVDTVYMVLQTPEIPEYDSRKAARILAHSWASNRDVTAMLTVSSASVADRLDPAEKVLHQLAADGKIRVIETRDRNCSDTVCTAVVDGQARYFDNNHVTNTTALKMRSLFAPFFQGAK